MTPPDGAQPAEDQLPSRFASLKFGEDYDLKSDVEEMCIRDRPKAAGEASGDTGFEAAAADRGRKAEPKAQELRKKQPERSLKAADRQRRRSRPGKRLGFSPSGKRGSVWWERRFAPI